MESLRAAFGGTLSEQGEDPKQVLSLLAREGTPGLMATPGPRFFGFVIGGSDPTGLAADWLTSAWDQNAGLFVASPTVAVLEETAGRWLCELMGLPTESAVGFATGAQMANFTGLAAARQALLARAGWNVADRGLYGAPEIQVVVGEEVHVTVLRALRFLGLGQARVHRVPTDAQGRMQASGLAPVLARCTGPTLVCLQAGNVNTCASDPFPAIIDAAHRHGAWVHVDGAFGRGPAPPPGQDRSRAGAADSWAVDATRAQRPYDWRGHRPRPRGDARGDGSSASYLVRSTGLRDGVDYVPE